MSNKKYDESIKKKIVQLYLQGRSTAELGKEYKISPTSIYSWVKLYTDQFEISLKDFNEIKKENIRLKQEVEILKQAMTIMNSK